MRRSVDNRRRLCVAACCERVLERRERPLLGGLWFGLPLSRLAFPIATRSPSSRGLFYARRLTTDRQGASAVTTAWVNPGKRYPVYWCNSLIGATGLGFMSGDELF